MSYDHLPAQERVRRGQQAQNEIISCLNTHYKWNITEKDGYADKVLKLDCEILQADGTRLQGQVKDRESGRDFIVAYRDPYFNAAAGTYTVPSDLDMIHESTRIGRDMVGKYDLYFCRDREKTWITVINAIRLKQIVEDTIVEWREVGTKLYKGNPFRSARNAGTEVRYHIDKSSGFPKILVFVSPDSFAKNELLRYRYMPV